MIFVDWHPTSSIGPNSCKEATFAISLKDEILTFFFDALRLCTLDALVFRTTVTSTIDGNPRKWIAYELNYFVLARGLTAKFVCNIEMGGS